MNTVSFIFLLIAILWPTSLILAYVYGWFSGINHARDMQATWESL